MKRLPQEKPMSGPKVVHIVTREEIIATCQGILAQLDQAINQWQHAMQNLAITDDTFLQGIINTREKFNKLLAEDKFSDIQRLVPIEIKQLQANIIERKQVIITTLAKQREEARQTKENAQLLINAIAQKGLHLPKALHNELTQIIQGNYQGSATAVLNQVFGYLVPEQQTNVLTAKQQAILNSMNVDKSTQTYTDWLTKHQTSQRDPRFNQIDHYLSELALENKNVYQSFIQRLNIAETETIKQQQNLLLDSILLDLSKTVQEAKKRTQLLAKLELIVAELKQKSVEPLKLDIQQFDQLTIDELTTLVENCEQQLIKVTNTITATYRQQTLLQCLSKLGYEVRSDMQTQWIKDGRLVIRNPATPGYGIEFTGQAENQRVQVRAVRFTQQEDRQRDKDIETLWCSDFAKLQAWLAKQGDSLILEKSLPIGQVAIKQVEAEQNSTIIKENVKKYF